MADDKKMVEVEAHVWAMINFAAKVSGMTESKVVEAAIVRMAQSDSENEDLRGRSSLGAASYLRFSERRHRIDSVERA